MKLAVDTGALLSLACSQYFDTILKEHTILLTQEVYDELKNFAVYNDFLGQKAKDLLKIKFIIKNPAEIFDLKIENADNAVFSIAKEEKCLAITDDMRAARIASEKLNLQSKPSFYLLLLLYHKKKINKSQLIKDLNSMLANRNWLNGALWEYALQLTQKL